MRLELVRIVKKAKQRSYTDNRRIVNAVTAEYMGEDGFTYRKTYESYEEPIIPPHGDNIVLTSKRIQWKA